ncbi:hypothetical protein Tco_0931145, partial [Tanacetum coccineum]
LSVRGNSRRTKNDRVKYEWDAKQGLVGNLKSSFEGDRERFLRWVEAEKVNSEVENEKWRRLLGNGYPRKGQKSKPKRQNRARERKERKEKSKSKPSQKVKVKSKSTPG